MSNWLNPKERYRRNLPHITPAQGLFFLTFNLAGAYVARERANRQDGLPEAEARRKFRDMEQTLHAPSPNSPRWLAEPEIARLVLEAALYRHGKVYDLDCICIMPNHVHLVFSMAGYGAKSDTSLARVMHDFKGYTAYKANGMMGRRGRFWQDESYDRLIRSPQEWRRCVAYVIDNPLKAGLVAHAQDWPWTWCRPIAGLWPMH